MESYNSTSRSINKAIVGSGIIANTIIYAADLYRRFRDNYVFGHNTLLENHMGNFMPSLGLTICGDIVEDILIEKFNWNPKLVRILGFLTIVGINLIKEGAFVAAGIPNPELWGDVAFGIIGYLFAKIPLLAYRELKKF